MDSEVENYSLSPIECSHWIERGVFDYLQKYDIFNGTEFDRFKAIYKQRFEENSSKVECLIKNDLDKGNVAFVLTTVCCFEALEELKMPESDAFQLTKACVCKPIYSYLVAETRKSFDSAEDPFQTLVQASKEREKKYFGESFLFERPIDNEHGYVLELRNACSMKRSAC